jgi:hypothetical protein
MLISALTGHRPNGKIERGCSMFKRKIDKSVISRLYHFYQRVIHTICFGIILVLPIGIYQGDPDSTSVVILGHAGTGQYASVLRDCNGPVASVGNNYSDFALKAHLAIPPGKNSPIVLGFAWGEWTSSGYRYPIRVYDENYNGSYGRSEPQRVHFSYLNPSFSLESKVMGMGFGYISGNRPTNFSEYNDDMAADFSGHLRLGDPKKTYFLASMNENTPLISGGGYYDLGIGFANSKNGHLFVGISAGLYDSPGFLGQFQLPMDKHIYFNGALRFGTVNGTPEYGLSGGISGHF